MNTEHNPYFESTLTQRKFVIATAVKSKKLDSFQKKEKCLYHFDHGLRFPANSRNDQINAVDLYQ